MIDRYDWNVGVYARTDEGLDSLQVQLTDALGVATTLSDSDDLGSERMSAVTDALEDEGCAIDKRRDIVIEVDTHSRDSGFNNFLEIVESPFAALEHLVVPASNDPEIEALIDTAVTHNVRIHIVPGPWFDTSSSGSMGDVLSRRAGVGQEWTGRPPLGFEVSDGHLVKASNFGDVVGTLRLVQTGKLSKRSAADELGTSRRTINRCLDNADRYGLAD